MTGQELDALGASTAQGNYLGGQPMQRVEDGADECPRSFESSADTPPACAGGVPAG